MTTIVLELIDHERSNYFTPHLSLRHPSWNHCTAILNPASRLPHRAPKQCCCSLLVAMTQSYPRVWCFEARTCSPPVGVRSLSFGCLCILTAPYILIVQNVTVTDNVPITTLAAICDRPRLVINSNWSSRDLTQPISSRSHP